METKKVFEVGKRYLMCSACDHECTWTYEVISRTAGTVVLQQVNKDGQVEGDTARFRINSKLTAYLNAEAVRPLGTYSMAPTLSADSEVEVQEKPAAKQVNMFDVNIKTYDEAKAKYQNTVILMRDGDFYDTYREDAKTCAKVLGITLCNRGGVEFAGFPHHALDIYLPKMVRSGYRIAIIDAAEAPAERKRIMERFC